MLNIFKYFLLFTIFGLGANEEIEVKLGTRSTLTPIYVSRIRNNPDESHFQALEELRSALVYDLSQNGYSSVVPAGNDREQKIDGPDPRVGIDAAYWKKEHVFAVIAIEAAKDALSITLFHIAKGSAKHYPPVSLQFESESDRRSIHQLADAIQKDLFGVRGIASSRIIFSQRQKKNHSLNPEWISDIWISDWDGRNAKRLTSTKGYCMSPGLMPSGDSYFFVSSDRNQSKIYRSDFQNHQTDIWIILRGNQMLPALSRDGSQIAFITDAAGRPDLFLQHLDRKGNPAGKPRQLYSHPGATQATPTFSPDSQKIAFVSDQAGSPKIYCLDIRDVRQRDLKLLTKKNRENTSPAWSPDGKKLAYSARVDGVRQIWIYDFETDEEWQLTFGAENKENPSWARDNLHLIYNTETHDVSELYVINLRQQEPVLINLGLGQKRFASWEIRD